ncbi:hypothetical protein FKW77_000047 [Venturia effusa]|uniref:DUF1254 domain-containing protein n=1 Tax=Venturia effusa TaxID=50376 RepID=A0A517LHU8_9PEZI|nr:hypothetical protein FKW77_000047 [Venturia effusa]
MVTITTLSDPSSTAVVRPNVDTFYSSVSYDIGASDLEIKILEVGSDRYWSAAFYTAYGDNYLNLGALKSSAAGKYILTLGQSIAADRSIPLGNVPDYVGSILAPHPIGVLLIRTVLKGSEDMVAAGAVQEGFTVTPIPRNALISGPALTASVFTTATNVTTERILSITAHFINTTFNTAPLPTTLAIAGLSGGLYQKPYVGVYGNDYVAGAYIGSHTYLALVVEEAIYPE